MRSSYYSDRRFKRGSLAHELCSKIEVTIEKEATFSTRSLLSPPRLSSSLSSPQFFPRRLCSLPLLIRREAHLAFVSTIYFSLFGREPSLPPLLRFSISRFNPVRSAGNSQNLLLGISWIIINAYAVAGGINRRVVLLLFLVLLPLLLFIIILLCCHRCLPIRSFGKTTTTAWNNSIQQATFRFELTRFLRIKHGESSPLIH